MVAAIFDGGGEEVEAAGRLRIQVIKDSAALEVVGGAVLEILANHFKQRVTGRDPFERGVFGEDGFVENDALVLASEFAEAGFEALADIDFRREELPQPAQLLRRHVLPGDPLVDRVRAGAQTPRNLLGR